MTWFDTNFRQQVTLWIKSGKNSSGDPTFEAPRTVLGRWETRSSAFTNAAGEEGLANSTVYLKEDVGPGDFLFEGTSSTTDPTAVTGAAEVQAFSKIKQLRGSGFMRTAFLNARTA